MTNSIFNNKIKFLDSPNLDAFGRLRVSNPYTLFDHQFEYSKNVWAINNYDVWEESVTNTASSSHLPFESTIEMSVGNAAGDKIIRQQHIYNRYQAGKSLLVLMTGRLAAKTGVISRLGYYDDYNGIYFEQSGEKSSNNFKIVLKSRAGVNISYKQKEFSHDRLEKDNFNLSGHILDIEKPQLFFIDLEWLSIGRIRAGVILDGQFITMHEFRNANIVYSSYMQTANLPIRYELYNESATTSQTTMTQICQTVISEGGYDRTPYQISVSNNNSIALDTTIRPVLNIRVKELFNSIENRGFAVPLNISISTETNDITWYIYLNPSITGGSYSWNNAHNTSIIEYDDTRTGALISISGGQLILSDVATTGIGNKQGIVVSDAIKTMIKLGRSYFNNSEYDLLTIAAKAHTGTANVRANLLLGEYK